MEREVPAIIGGLSGHAAARGLAREVQRVHHRYASEVVKAFQLCPFLHDVESDFGFFCVVLDREPVVATALEAALGAPTDVVHLVYPLVDAPAREFETFASALARELKKALARPPVYAAFHPALSGDRATPAQLIGLIRRAPDPFVQLVPEGVQPGGTVLAAPGVIPNVPQRTRGVDRLGPADVDRLLAALEEIRIERNRAYAPYLAAMT